MKESQKRLLGGKVDKLACTPGDRQSITAGGAEENVPGEARAWLHELSLPWLKYQSLSSVRLCDPMDCSPPASSVHGISQATVLEWVAISFSRGSSLPRDHTQVSSSAGRFFTI